ncbi:F-box only protein 21-like [Oppia nitens]|uniref:F-box only protein 21-like n=1 Tax=Oppia nitens TaxID=1686743 RepID=UPI0023DBA888|nr:F-box only protein 21-like [Oppia nitens]
MTSSLISTVTMSAAGIESLPNEILEAIVTNKCLTAVDLCRLSCTAKRFQLLIAGNGELWRRKFVHQWPLLWRNGLTRRLLSQVTDWQGLVADRYACGRHVQQEVAKLADSHYFDEELSNESFKAFVDYQYELTTDDNHRQNRCPELTTDLIHLFQMDELECLLRNGSERKNLTIKYYALKVLRFLRHELLRRQWLDYLANDSGHQSVDDFFNGALMISSWFQMNRSIDEEHYRRQVELIAQLTIDELAVNYPSNAIVHQNAAKCLPDSEAQQLTESKWSAKDCRQIMQSLNEVMFNQLHFMTNDDDYYEMNNSFMDQVIDRRLGIPITYCILYHTICAKLGVKTFGVNFPHHFILKWKQYNDDESHDSYRWIYIDVYNGGQQLTSRSPLLANHSDEDIDRVGVCSLRDVFCRMCRNLVEIGRQQEISSDGLICLRNALELLCILSPEENESQLLLSRVYLHLNINLELVNDMLAKISERDPNSIGVVMFLRQSVTSQLSAKRNTSANNNNNRKSAVKHRNVNNDIKYAIGMIMLHKKYNYRCVIYGWDSKCAASRDWIYQMGVYRLPNKDKQPFYNVLVDDGSTRYAAQENLEPCGQSDEIKHLEIGKYFQEFAETHYIPNEQKAGEYPDDDETLILMLRESL